MHGQSSEWHAISVKCESSLNTQYGSVLIIIVYDIKLWNKWETEHSRRSHFQYEHFVNYAGEQVPTKISDNFDTYSRFAVIIILFCRFRIQFTACGNGRMRWDQISAQFTHGATTYGSHSILCAIKCLMHGLDRYSSRRIISIRI